MTEPDTNSRHGIPAGEYLRIEHAIGSAESPVGIDALKTHVLILYKLEQMERRLEALEGRAAGG